jgi:hypothetical protein
MKLHYRMARNSYHRELWLMRKFFGFYLYFPMTN